MSYSPATSTDRAEMLAAIGVKSIDELFADVPAGVRFPELKLPGPLSEMETLRELMNLGEANADTQHPRRIAARAGGQAARPRRHGCATLSRGAGAADGRGIRGAGLFGHELVRIRGASMIGHRVLPSSAAGRRG